ncbi:hypothetical protein R3W88_034139 [Solanum pinnatisectum]|uniref:Uncharacterized protein n=1 Tax=Solanum pinnatisectum TaxID=50273 RepID=A0AAV9K0M1_9SOLN|nr:hypothetical protein R3W88_034139 [Solanum pinnatisectum]
MTDPTTPYPICQGHIMIPNDSLKTSENRTTIQHDEHIARFTQDIEDLLNELTWVRDLTNLSITLQSPQPKPRNIASNPLRFLSLDSQVPKHFPQQQPPPTNNNLPPTIHAYHRNFPPIYTPPQINHLPTLIMLLLLIHQFSIQKLASNSDYLRFSTE